MNIKQSLTKKVVLLFTALTLILMLLISVGFLFIRVTIKQSLTNALDLVINNNADNLDRLFSRIELVISMIEDEYSGFVKYLMDYSDDMVVNIQTYQQFENELRKTIDISLESVAPYYVVMFFADDALPMAGMFPNSSYRGIFDNQNYSYSSLVLYGSQNARHEEWYRQTLEKNGDLYWFKSEDNKNVLYMSKAMYAYREAESGFRRLGVFLIRIDVSLLTQNFDLSRMTYGTVAALFDKNNNVIYSNSSVIEGQSIINAAAGDGKVLTYNKELHGGLSLTTLVPVNDINKTVNGQFVISATLAAVMLLLGGLVVVYISRGVVRPITALSRHIRLNEALDTISCSAVGDDEIGVIYQNYNNFIEKLKTLIGEIYEKTEREKEARLKMLQAQMNPHFIYNTLDSICCFSLLRQQEDVADVLSRLANLIRYNVKDPDAMITVKKEMEQIYDYVQIQRFRDGVKIELTTNVDGEFENMLIPKMIIQPLVENAFFYGGVNLRSEVLKIDIFFTSEREALVIRIKNNGCRETADRINAHLAGEINLSKNKGGFGIRSVNERIQMKFGEGYGLRYENEKDGTVTAIINAHKIQK